ncbi:hypothetical protein JCM10212_006377 [Sporobolomyces blumeae]
MDSIDPWDFDLQRAIRLEREAGDGGTAGSAMQTEEEDSVKISGKAKGKGKGKADVVIDDEDDDDDIVVVKPFRSAPTGLTGKRKRAQSPGSSTKKRVELDLTSESQPLEDDEGPALDRTVKARSASGQAGKNKGKTKRNPANGVICLSTDDEADQWVGSSSRPSKKRQQSSPSPEHHPARPSSTSRKARVPPRPTPPPPTPLAQLLLLLPDLCPELAAKTIAEMLPTHSLDQVVDHLLSLDPPYPRAAEKERKEREEREAREKYDWGDVALRKRDRGDRPSHVYEQLALDQLNTDFPFLSTTLIRHTFQHPDQAKFFAPTYFALLKLERGYEESLRPQPTAEASGLEEAALSTGTKPTGVKRLKHARKPPIKATMMQKGVEAGVDGVEREVEKIVEAKDEGLETEMEWVKKKILADRKTKKLAKKTQALEQKRQAEIEQQDKCARLRGTAVECQCCYDEVAPENTTKCEEGHTFCTSCAIRNAEHQIGAMKYRLPCMTTCSAAFAPASYKKWMPDKLRETLERLETEKTVEMAFEGVEGFEKCPFCPFACFIENENERLIRCLRGEECGKVSCRKCKKEDHLPMTCEEADLEARMGGVHAVEDAMSTALIRSCPKCQAPFVKSDGCNKITCSRCNALSCYICQKQVKGYEHFEQRMGATGSSKCPLFDDTEARNFQEVEEARRKAQEGLKDAQTRTLAEKLAVEKPNRPGRAPPRIAAPARPLFGRVGGFPPVGAAVPGVVLGGGAGGGGGGRGGRGRRRRGRAAPPARPGGPADQVDDAVINMMNAVARQMDARADLRQQQLELARQQLARQQLELELARARRDRQLELARAEQRRQQEALEAQRRQQEARVHDYQMMLVARQTAAAEQARAAIEDHARRERRKPMSPVEVQLDMQREAQEALARFRHLY